MRQDRGLRRRIQQPTHNRAHRPNRSEEHTSELQSPCNLVCRLLLEKKKKKIFLELVANQHNTKLREYVTDTNKIRLECTLLDVALACVIAYRDIGVLLYLIVASYMC